MKVAQINATCGSGSTGKIAVEISRLLSDESIENRIFYASGRSDHPLGIRYMKPWEIKKASLESRIFGNWGFNSHSATRRLIAELESFSPDVVHLHNMHGHNCDLRLLLEYFKKKKTKLVWTFHDCWLFTGYCMHYDMIGCEKWRDTCKSCPQRSEYSWFSDKSHTLFERKRKLLSDLDLTIVTPSKWLHNQVYASFLKDHPVKVINNGIDRSAFKPTAGDFREKHGLTEKHVILGVSFGWNDRKGLDVFVRLAEELSDDHRVVLVGTNDEVDKKLPKNIVSIHRTQDREQLAEIYTAADVFVNPTREETYPSVNMEALSCGTPVVTFDTGGSAEIIDEFCGKAVAKNDFDALKDEIIGICESKRYSAESCLERAAAFDMYDRFRDYIDLYKEVTR